MKLLTQEIKRTLPNLRSQEKKGGKAVVHVKFFTPDANWTWYVTEGEPVIHSGRVVDYMLFGLVDGFEKEIGYFCLSEIAKARGPLGLAIERDLYFGTKTLEEIAPELFKE